MADAIRVLVIGAHLDHLGMSHELMPGANDDASGVAVLLAVAEALSRSPVPLKRSVLFVLFVFARRLIHSPFGLSLRGIRENYLRMPAIGAPSRVHIRTIYTISAAIAGIAGALFGMVGGFVGPNNYTFADSLILVSILLLGGIGNPWGLVVATFIVVVVPEKLQTIQEYRFLLYAVMVIGVLLFRPDGLLPRPVRHYFPGWRP